MVETIFWYNGNLSHGNFLEIAIDDPGLLYGATAFTTLRTYHQSLHSQLTNWNRHCDRLLTSLQTFGWQQPDWERLQHGAETLIAYYPVLRIAIFPDGREWIVGRFLPEDLTERQQYGIKAWVADKPEYRRSLPQQKTGNYLAAWLALREGQRYGAKEAILVDASGNWLETSTGNLWGWRDGQWWTPPGSAGILPGVARSQLIDWLVSQNLFVGEVSWDADWVGGLEAIAFTNSVVEVVPVHTVVDRHGTLTYDPLHGGLEQLRSLFRG